MVKWNIINELSEAKEVAVFSGGACNIRDHTGQLLRNTERDTINGWLTDKEIKFYDPQIHPDTHGTEYIYEVHHELEIAARRAARVNLYEISPRTFGGVASMEIAVDEFNTEQPTIIFFSDGKQHTDIIPSHSDAGYPLFVPYGLYDSEEAIAAHYREFVKNGNMMRKYLVRMAEDLPALTVTFNEEAFEGDRVITPTRMHAVDIMKAIVDAAGGRRVIVNFTGGTEAFDQKGNPLFISPDKPPKAQMRALLDQYVDEGNALRAALSTLVRINVFTRVVYTQRDAINALIDLMKLKGIDVEA